jgi:hypothetical protein
VLSHHRRALEKLRPCHSEHGEESLCWKLISRIRSFTLLRMTNTVV